MSIIKHNINLKEQASKSYIKNLPSNSDFVNYTVTIDSSEYTEYSFTGTKEEIDAQEELELAKASFSPVDDTVTEIEIREVGTAISTTKTRQDGDLWQLQVKVQRILQTLNPETENEQAQFEKYGQQGNPKIVNTSVTVLQQSILFKFANENPSKWTPEKLGALKQYINGASEYTTVPTIDANGQPIQMFLKDILPIDSDVKLALKNPVYYVPSVNVTVSYWSSMPITSIGNVGTPKNPSGGSFTPSAGYTSIFMGASSSPAEGGGYQIQENYTIGQYDTSLFTSSSNS